MTEEAFQEAIRNLRNNAGRLERAGIYWSDYERERLKEMIDEGNGISEIALCLQRTEPAVFQQIEKMDLFHRKDQPRRRRGPHRKHSCRCSSCEVDERLCPLHGAGQKKQKKGRQSNA